MDLFHDYTMHWWQFGLLKALMLAAGLALGAYFAPVVSQYYSLLIAIVVVLAIYFIYMMYTDCLRPGGKSTPAESLGDALTE